MLVSLALLVLGFIVLLLLEYQTLIKSASLWQGIKPLLIMYTVPSIGVILAEVFEPDYALLIAVLWLFVLFVFTAVSRLNTQGSIKAALNIFFLSVFLICTFATSPLYMCRVEKDWYILGKNATLISQENGINRLCHESANDPSQTECHDFVGGYHGLFTSPAD